MYVYVCIVHCTYTLVCGVGGTTDPFARQRLKKIRSLKEQMMTTCGMDNLQARFYADAAGDGLANKLSGSVGSVTLGAVSSRGTLRSQGSSRSRDSRMDHTGSQHVTLPVARTSSIPIQYPNNASGNTCQITPFQLNTERRVAVLKAKKEDSDLTRKMAGETFDLNNADNTWPLFSVPGFTEVVGPDEIYMSMCRKQFQ